MFSYQTFAVGRLQCNCSIVADTVENVAIVIDPGDEIDKILAHLDLKKMRVAAVVHTHAHFDHMGATEALVQACGAPSYLHNEDKILHQMLPLQAQMFGVSPISTPPIDKPLKDGDAIAFGQYELGVLHTPGHTPGSSSFHVSGQDLCFTGDTLFAGGVGRTDFPGGDAFALVRSIKNKLYTLHGACKVVPGHGPCTHIDQERRYNPFVQAS